MSAAAEGAVRATQRCYTRAFGDRRADNYASQARGMT